MDDLKLIKKHYGEKMMHLCRELFPTILETPGLLYATLTKKFYPTRYLYKDIVNEHYVGEFKNIIYDEINRKDFYESKTTKTPQELMDEAGYTLYECKTVEDVKQFENYFEPNERLCTFYDIYGRLCKCHIFFAVKKNVDDIKREKFLHPERQDDYGTSVISIQFTRGHINTLSIKNRYNHTVSNPDATFSNNLENIIEGLTDAFAKKYDLNINETTVSRNLPGYVLGEDGRYYKYNFEYLNTYFCPDNIIIDYNINSKGVVDSNCTGGIKHYDKSRYIVFDRFILDMHEKKLEEYRGSVLGIKRDGFVEMVGDISSITVTNKKEQDEKIITINDSIEITIDGRSKFIKYKDPNVIHVPYKTLSNSTTIEEIDLPNAKTIDDYFLKTDTCIKKVNLPQVEEIGNGVLAQALAISLEKIELPKVKVIGDNFFQYNTRLKEIILPKVRKIGNNFLHSNHEIQNIDFPHLERVGHEFLPLNSSIKGINLPRLSEVGNSFLENNQFEGSLLLPKLAIIGGAFLRTSFTLEAIYLPEAKTIGPGFLLENHRIKELSLPEVIRIGNLFMRDNEVLESIDLPKCKGIGSSFLNNNKNLTSINIPELEHIDMYYSLSHNKEARDEIAAIIRNKSEDTYQCILANIEEEEKDRKEREREDKIKKILTYTF